MLEKPTRPTAVVFTETVARGGHNRLTEQELKNLRTFVNRYVGFSPGFLVGTALGAATNHLELAPVGGALGALVSRVVVGLSEKKKR